MAQRRIKRVCILAEALRSHSIDATVFEPFVIAELGGTPDLGTQTTEFAVTLHDIGRPGTRMHQLRIKWLGTNALRGNLPVQGRVITEWAACGIACAALRHYTDLWVRATARVGEGFDYWVTDGVRQYGMEVSGTLSAGAGEMQERHRDKHDQLLSSLSVGGYVVIVGFTRREIIFSYHALQEASR